MSKYTTEVRFICESNAGLTESEGFNNVDSIIEEACPAVFNFEFPIFDEEYRLPLEKKILRHYYTREICEETVGLWKLRLADRLNMIMPYYNELYKTTLWEYNPLWDVDYKRDHAGTSSGVSEENVTSSQEYTDNANNSRTGAASEEAERNNNYSGTRSEARENESNNNRQRANASSRDMKRADWDLYNDTPQGGIEGVQGFQSVYTEGTNPGAVETSSNLMLYLTSARKETHHEESADNGNENETIKNSGKENNIETSHSDNNEKGKNNRTYNERDNRVSNRSGSDNRVGKNNVTNTDHYIERVFGKMNTRTYASLIKEFRNNIINIDEMIIEELKDLFFGLW